MQTTQDLLSLTSRVLDETPVVDIHTHIFSPCFARQLLYGADELLTYHYLAAETIRSGKVNCSRFWSLDKDQQADLVWQTLFLDGSPVSEACRGFLTVMQELGFDTAGRKLECFRQFCKQTSIEEYVDIVFDKAGVAGVVMTNDPFDAAEVAVWRDNPCIDSRFKAACRIDPLLNSVDAACAHLKAGGYDAEPGLSRSSLAAIRQWLLDRIDEMKAVYLAASLPPEFRLPEMSPRGRIIEECIIPVCRERDIPFAMMVGVRKLVNPELKLAGDSVGKSDIRTIEYLCSKYPCNRFMVTMLARENQHELCVTARKFRNLMLFGCWWFLNNPSLIEEMTRMRLELLGTSFLPQHSDARVLDQLIYKWSHSRRIIARVLADKYADLAATGWEITESEVRRDAAGLLGGNFSHFLSRKL